MTYTDMPHGPVDLDTIMDKGFYTICGCLNGPKSAPPFDENGSTIGVWLELQVLKANNNPTYAHQILMGSTYFLGIFHRYCINGIWGSWIRLTTAYTSGLDCTANGSVYFEPNTLTSGQIARLKNKLGLN